MKRSLFGESGQNMGMRQHLTKHFLGLPRHPIETGLSSHFPLWQYCRCL